MTSSSTEDTTMTDCQKLQVWQAKRSYCNFWLSVVVTIARDQCLRSGRGRKPQVCCQNCSDICHTVGDVSTSGVDGHIAITGYLPVSHLFVDTFSLSLAWSKTLFTALELQ